MEVVSAEPGACVELVGSLPDRSSANTWGKAKDAAKEYRIVLPLEAARKVPGDALAVLHAMGTISGLLEGTSAMHCQPDGSTLLHRPSQSQIEDAAVAIACEEGLVTSLTSSVGVMLRRDPLDPASVQRADIPLQYPAGRTLWQGECGDSGSTQNCSRSRSMRSSTAAVASQLQQAHELMRQNIERVLARGEKLEELVDKTDTLQFEAKIFSREAKSSPNRGISGLLSAIGRGMGSMLTYGGGTAGTPSSTRSTDAPKSAVRRAEEELSTGAGNCHADELRPSSAASPAQVTTPSLAGIVAAASPQQVLSLLNMERTVHGSIPATPQVLQALAQQAARSDPSCPSSPQQGACEAPALAATDAAAILLHGKGARPAALQSDEAWATVLALAYLRKHLPGQQELWKGLEAKALQWLSTVWPAEAGRSVGSAILAAMKLV